MKVWLVQDCPPYESSMLVGIYSTQDIALKAIEREQYTEYIVMTEVEVQTGLE